MLGQSSKDQESPPASTISACAHTLYSNSKWIKITCSDYARLDCADRFKPSVNEEYKGLNDAPSKNPFRDLKRDHWFDLSAPSIEEQEVRSGKSVNPIHRD